LPLRSYQVFGPSRDAIASINADTVSRRSNPDAVDECAAAPTDGNSDAMDDRLTLATIKGGAQLDIDRLAERCSVTDFTEHCLHGRGLGNS
jgi:hypothetical protein